MFNNNENLNNVFRPNLEFKKSVDGRLEFYKSKGYKATYSLLSMIVFLILYLFLPEFSIEAIQGYVFTFGLVNWYIWLNSYIDFDEFMQTITIKRGLNKFFKPQVIPYSKIKEVFVSEEKRNKSYETQFYFYLRLKNGNSRLLFYMDGVKFGEKAFNALSNHTALPVSLKRL